jgi:hypothetical protein
VGPLVADEGFDYASTNQLQNRVGSGPGGGTMTTWLDPADLSAVPGSAWTTISSAGGTFTGPLSHIYLALRGGEDAVFDEIRVGPTLADTAPHMDTAYAQILVPDGARIAVDTSGGTGIPFSLEWTDNLLDGWTGTGVTVVGDGGSVWLYDVTDDATRGPYRAGGSF